MKYAFGATGTYIQDHPFHRICSIPVEAAVEWVKRACPEAVMGLHTKAKDLTVGVDDPDTSANVNGWLNKLFILLDCTNAGKWVALVNWDGRFSIYVEN